MYQTNVELVLVEDFNDINDPLAHTDTDGDIDIQTKDLQLNDEKIDESDFFLKTEIVTSNIVIKEDFLTKFENSSSIKSEIEHFDNDNQFVDSDDEWIPFQMPLEQSLIVDEEKKSKNIRKNVKNDKIQINSVDNNEKESAKTKAKATKQKNTVKKVGEKKLLISSKMKPFIY